MAMTEDELDEAKRDLLREIERGDEAGATDTALVLIEEIAQVAAERDEARREVERLKAALRAVNRNLKLGLDSGDELDVHVRAALTRRSLVLEPERWGSTSERP